MALNTYSKDINIDTQGEGLGTLRLIVTEDSYDIAGNYSNCSYTLQLIIKTNYRWRASSGSWSLWGSASNSGNIVSMAYYTDTTTLASGSFTVPHNADGTGTFAIGFSFTSSYRLSGSDTLSGTLSTIPRASEPSATTGNIEESLTIYTNRKSSSFTHTLTYSFGGLSGTIATGVGDYFVWNIPSSLYSQIPNNTSGTGIIYCTTYNGGSQVGETKACYFTVYTVKNRVNPVVSISAVDTNKTLDTGVTIQSITGDTTNKTIIKGMSNVNVSLSATSRGSSSISATQISSGTGSYVNNTGNFNTTFVNSETASYTGKAVDSRGYDGYAYVTNLTMLDYIKLSINPIELYRTNQTENTLYAKGSGKYFNGSFNGTNNILSFKYRYKEKGSSSYSNWITQAVTISGNAYSFDFQVGTNFDYTKIYDFEFKVEDLLIIKTVQVSSTPGIPIMGLFEDFIEIFGEPAFYK
jgi:hypothetical protein